MVCIKSYGQISGVTETRAYAASFQDLMNSKTQSKKLSLRYTKKITSQNTGNTAERHGKYPLTRALSEAGITWLRESAVNSVKMALRT